MAQLLTKQLTPIVVGFIFGPEVLGGLLAGVTVSGVLMGMFQSNAGGAITNETIDINLIKIFIDGPEVSLNGSPTVSPVTAALCGSDFL